MAIFRAFDRVLSLLEAFSLEIEQEGSVGWELESKIHPVGCAVNLDLLNLLVEGYWSLEEVTVQFDSLAVYGRC